MSAKNHKPGDKVKFRGERGPDGKLVCVYPSGPDVFTAYVAYIILNSNMYALRWDDGTPVGLPFHDRQLESGD